MKARTDPAVKLPAHLHWENRPRTSPEAGRWLVERRAWLLAHGYGKLDAIRRSEADQSGTGHE